MLFSPAVDCARASMSRRVRHALAVLAVVSVAACSSGPVPRMYVLEPIVVDASARPVEGISALGVATASLPGYARDQRVATRNDRNRVSMDDGHRWAEAPEDAITRVFAERLRYHAGATVLIEPYPRGFTPDARVEINMDRMLRERTGGVDMAGQIALLDGDGRGLMKVRPFRVLIPGDSTDHETFFVRVAEALDRLARLAVSSLIDAQ